MKISTSTVILLLLIPLVLASETEQLPALSSLGIMTTDADCSNAENYLNVARNDQNKLNNFVNTDIPNSKTNLDNARSLTSQACQLSSQLRTLKSFVQLESGTSLQSTLQSLQAKLESDVKEPELYKALIAPKIDEVFTMLAELGQVGTAAKISSLCSQIYSSIDSLKTYLDNMRANIINNYVNSWMPNRINTLTAKVQECAVVSYSGFYDFVFNQHVFSLAHYGTRSDSFYVPFITNYDRPLPGIPNIALSIVALDMALTSFDIEISYTKVYANGFSLEITVGPSAVLYALSISWFATVEAKSGLYLGSSIIDWNSNSDMRSTAESTGERTYYGTISFNRSPSGINWPRMTVGFAGAKFGGDYNPRLTIWNYDNSRIQFKTYLDTRLYRAKAYCIYWDSMLGHDYSNWVSSPIQYSYANLDFKPHFDLFKAVAFVSLYHLDLIREGGYCFKTYISQSSSTKIKLDFFTCSYGKSWMTRYDIFETCKRQANCN